MYPFGPDQAKVTVAGVPVPVSETMVCAQVIIPPALAAACGLTVSMATGANTAVAQVVKVSVAVK